ncbi:MAG TPA: GAF domain-containing protein, partial [Longimicrobiaceae bacterium]|nr:GAF domain-containing protein [Longimicrobiaceae bacterium]
MHDPVRLAALRHTVLLDTPPEESFDRLTRLAARALGAPVALLSLVEEERQFFKGFVGLPEPWASRRESPLSHSFCQHVVASGEPLLVEDAREHPQLHPDLPISELGIVAYAGVPLRTREGEVLGTLCVTDSRPREWTDEDVETLHDLAAAVVAEIERSMVDHESLAVRQWTGSILDGLPDGLATLDRQWRFTYTNARAEQILARSRDELRGRSIWEVFPEAVDTTFYREYHRAAAEQVAVRFTEFYPPLNLWVDVHVYPSPEGISLYFRDITERVHTEEDLQRALERYRLVGRATHDTIWEQDLVTGEGSWNEGIRTMFGYAPEEVESAYSWWEQRVHPEDRPRLLQTMREVIIGRGDYWSGEYRFLCADGSYATVLDRAYVARNEKGEPLRIVGSMLDITERKRAEEALRRRAVQLRGLAHAALEINSTLAIDRLLQSITERARELIGAHQAVASLTVNQSWAQAINAVSLSEKYASWCPFDIPPDGSGIYSLVCETNRPMRLTQEELESHPRWRAVGEVVGAHPPLRGWLAAPLIGRDGRNLGVIQLSDRYEGEFTAEDEAILVQLAQLASVTIENSQLIEEAQAASRAKSEFISAMSHEFRTPLTAIVGYGELLELELAGPLNEKQREQIGRIQISAWHLTELIEDILTFSRMEAGREELRVEHVEVASIVAAAAAMVEPVAEKKGLAFRVRLPDEPLALQIDPGKVRQILVNLLGNAVKFTDAGEVCLQARADGEAVVLEVHDTGIGIAREQLERIFDPFWQVDQSATRQAGGTGLGLTVTRSLARLLGGEIGVESTPGEGSTFRV